MKLKKYRVLAAVLCAAFLMCGITTTAYAGGGEEWEDGTGGPEWEGLDPVEPTEPPATPEPEPNPFTPDGQGTMVDNATDQDGKEFFTIMAADESVFYLVIDRQRETENVYFLNAVTVADLMALAEPSPNRSRSQNLPPSRRNPSPSRKNPAGRGRSCWCWRCWPSAAGPGGTSRFTARNSRPPRPARTLTRRRNTVRTMAAVNMTTSPRGMRTGKKRRAANELHSEPFGTGNETPSPAPGSPPG